MTKTLRSLQTGVALLEGLIAMLLFSVAVIGLAKLQANLTHQDILSQQRVKATMLAQELLNAAAADYSNLGCYTVPVATQSGCGNSIGSTYTTSWVAEVQANLPGSTATPPVVTLLNNQLTATVSWKNFQDTTVHNIVLVTTIGT